MKAIVSKILLLFFGFFCVNVSFSQVIKEQSNKIQLTNGMKLESHDTKSNLIKLQATTVTPIIKENNSSDNKKKKKKIEKPPKALKYGERKRLYDVKKDDE